MSTPVGNDHDSDNRGDPQSESPVPSTLPEVYNYPGVEALNIPGHSEDKQVIAVHRTEQNGYASLSSPSALPLRKRRRWIFAAVVLLVGIVLAAVLIPVGLLVLKNDGDDPTTANASASPTASATSGPTASPDDPVLKGTRLATMGSRMGDIFLYYQSGDGGLHFISMSSSRRWQGSRDLGVTDAKLGTPLASTSATINGTILWWLFYVDKNNQIRNIYSEGDPVTWHKGSVDSKEYKVADETSIAFTVSRGIEYDEVNERIDGGINLYATDSDGIVREYIYDDKTERWGDGTSFDNADGYSGATTWSVFSSAFFFTRSKTGPEIQVWWRDYNDSGSNKWHLGPVSSAPAIQGGSMWGGFAFAFQGPDGTIRGHRLDRDDSDPSAARWGVAYDIYDENLNGDDYRAANGTGLAGWYFFPSPDPDAEPSTRLHVFYQAEESGDVVEAVWDYAKDEEDNAQTIPGPWRFDFVPIN